MSDYEFPALKDAQGKLDTARKALADVMREAKDGDRYDMAKVTSVPGGKTAVLEWIRAKNAELPQLKQELEAMRDIGRAAEQGSVYDAENKGSDQKHENKGGGEAKGLGEQFIKSLAFKRKGEISQLDIGLKTLFDRAGGWTPESVRSGLVTLMPMRPAPSVADHIPTIPINQTSYKYMEETTYDASAAVEKAEGATFGEAALALTERSQTVEKLPVWLPMTDEQLEDQEGAQAYVEARLINMLRQRIDFQILAGSGATPLLLGTENKAGIQTQALGGDTVLDAAHKLFTLIREDGFAEPTVAFIRPSKWQNVILLKTADGQYIWGHPSSTGPQTIWGVPVVQTTAVTSTKLIAGDYATYSLLCLKRGLDVQITNSHASDFINGKQAIRVDTRLAMVHIRPKAFGQVTGL